MKKLLIIITVLLMAIGCYSQTGQLTPDTLHARKDTVYFKAILYWDFSKGITTKTDSGYAVVRTVPMVFIGSNGSTAKTDQLATLDEKWFIMPKRTPLDRKNVISYYVK